MNTFPQPKAIEILLVEDNPGDVRLTREGPQRRQVPQQHVGGLRRAGGDGLALP